MKTFSSQDISSIKMATNPPMEIVNAGFRVINIDRWIYEFIHKELKWVKIAPAFRKNYGEIPEIIN